MITTRGKSILLAALAAAGYAVNIHEKPASRTVRPPRSESPEVQRAAMDRAQAKRERRQKRNLGNAFAQSCGNPRATINPFNKAP